MTVAEWIARVGPSDRPQRAASTFVDGLRHAGLFSVDRDIIVARAPGRLDVIGGIADYSGSLVLEWPLADATFVALQRHPDPTLTMVSGPRCATVCLPEVLSLDYDDARRYFGADHARQWTAYIAGAFIVLAHDHGVAFSEGARCLVASTVPEGKGLASSAALEVAAMTAICAAYDVMLEPRRLALLCQRVENFIAGAPCGVMDQITAELGEFGKLLVLLCQPAEVQPSLPLPRGLELWGIDSGIRHAIGGADYATVRAAAFMGRRIIEDLTGRPRDYLANVTPTELEALACHIPDSLTGREFLERFGAIDRVTTIDPDRVYPVRVATAHPIYEHARAREFGERLSRLADTQAVEADTYSKDAQRLGALMYESHASYSACGLGSDGTDTLVAYARDAGPTSGIYGAKITGGGRGGTVAILAGTDGAPHVHAIARRYESQIGHAVRVFTGSSSGAAACGVCAVRL